jgi:hypothetical protein
MVELIKLKMLNYLKRKMKIGKGRKIKILIYKKCKL